LPVKLVTAKPQQAAPFASPSDVRTLIAEHPELVDRLLSVMDAVTIADARAPDQPILYVNDRFLELTGYEAHEVIGRNCRFLQGRDTDPVTRAQIAKSLATHQPISVEILNYTKDGRRFWNELSIEPVLDQNGEASLYIAHQRDISRRQEAEHGVAYTQMLFEFIYDAADLGVVITNRRGSITRMNAAFARVYGESGDALIGENLSAILTPSEPTIKLVSATCAASEFEATLKRPDGKERTVLVRRAPGDLLETAGVQVFTLLDLTERRMAEALLKRAITEAELASRAKSTFLAGMSHELRTPLNAIIGFSEVIEQACFGPLGNERYEEYIGDIRRSAEHLLSIINTILDLSKIEAGRMDVHAEPLDVERMLTDCYNLVRERAIRRAITIELQVSENIPVLFADPTKMRQVLINLLTNAVKFSHENTTITVHAAEDAQGGIAITVRDRGVGMTPEQLKIAMEPFGQVDNALSRKVEGTGLGLPLTKALIELHEGGMEIETAPGEGTAITARFPPERTQRMKRS
jgi:PAS domain S-box-containing protein